MNIIRRNPEIVVGLLIVLVALFIIISLLALKNYALPYVQNY